MKNYPFFSAKELSCKCGKCDGGDMDDAFMFGVVVELRKQLGPLTPTSAYRCPAHNVKVSNTGLSGPHTTGKAIDLACVDGRSRMRLVKAAMALGVTRIGIAKNFVHLDGLGEEDGFPSEVIWNY